MARAPFRRHRAAGIALVKVMIAAAMVALCGSAGLRALLEINRKAAAMRILNNARAVVQRNIDTVHGVPFNASNTPSILAITSSSGVVYDSDGGGDNLVDIVVPRTSTNAYVRGTLTRTVVAQSNPESVDIRRITFSLSYTYRRMPYTFAMTTLRSMD